MIALEQASARWRADKGGTRAVLQNVTLAWERGVLAVLGAQADGTTALLELLAGNLRASVGSVLVDGASPEDARQHVAYVPLEAALPDALRVDEVCELAGRIRRGPPITASKRLAPLGLEALATRRVRSLSPGEARAVSLALAITSSAKVLLIEEPLAGLDPAAPARVVEALRARGAAGAAIVVTTASVREATRLGDQLGVLTRGVFTHLHPTLAHVGPAGARLRVVLAATTEAAAPFLEALSAEPGVQSVASTPFVTSEARPSAIAILVGGPDLLKLARGVSAAAARTGALVEAIESAVMPLEAIRALVVPRPATVVAAPKSAPPASMPPPSVPPPAPPGPPSASSGGAS